MNRRPEGGTLPKDFRNQNARILDDVRVRTGIPLGQEFGLQTIPTLQPVFVVDPDSAPLISHYGSVPFAVAAAVGFRSEVLIALAAGDRNTMLRVFVRLFANTGAVAFEIMGNITMTPAATLVPVDFDGRYWLTTALPGGPGVTVGTKNTAAATAGGNRFGGTINPNGSNEVVIGPFLIDGAQTNAAMRGLIIRPTADNLACTGILDWRILQRQPT